MSYELLADSEKEVLESLPEGHIARFLPDVDFAFIDDKFEWTDPVWGKVDVDTWGVEEDMAYVPLFKELLVHPAIKRLIGIEQLTLPDGYHTVPNAERFSRWEHITGSAEITSQLIDKWNRKNPDRSVSAREKAKYILRTMLSDAGHTFGSHLGDWIEGDESEEAHDWSLKSYLEMTGVAAVIRQYEIDIDKVCLTEITTQDFVESKSPNLCVDRIDYGTREIHRTNPYFWNEAHRFSIDDFELDMDFSGSLQVTMPQLNRALLFAKAYELLPQEDWSESLQRLQTHLYTRLAKLLLITIAEGKIRTLVGRSEVPPIADDDDWTPEAERHYRDVLNYSEGIIGEVIDGVSRGYEMLSEPKDEIFTAIAGIDACMQQISQCATSFVMQTRRKAIADFTRSVAKGEAEPNDRLASRPTSYDMGDGGPIRSIAFEPAREQPPGDRNKIHLKAQKMRKIDPSLAIYEGNAIKISDTVGYTPSVEAYENLEVSIVYGDDDIRDIMARLDTVITERWPALMHRKRLSGPEVRNYQRVLEMLVAGLDYARYTQQGALHDEINRMDLERAREWANTR